MRENDPEIKNISVVIKFMMTISASTAACERGFSCMNRQKTKERCNFTQEALEYIMYINIDGPSVGAFDSSSSLERWVDEANGDRRERSSKSKKIGPEEMKMVENLLES